jgi:hypothetical protein
MGDLIRLHIIVEGQTEEMFVNRLIREPLSRFNICTDASCITTKRVLDRPDITYKGGLSKYEKARGDIQRWLNKDKRAFLTTMFDLYGLPENFPKMDEARKYSNPYKKVEIIENGFADDINNANFIPYIQLHEFEGLLFSDVEIINYCLSSLSSRSYLSELRKIRSQFKTPEEINNNIETAPSKRLLKICDFYQKMSLGIMIAEEIGLEKIRVECPHFADWFTKLVSLEIAQ